MSFLENLANAGPVVSKAKEAERNLEAVKADFLRMALHYTKPRSPEENRFFVAEFNLRYRDMLSDPGSWTLQDIGRLILTIPEGVNGSKCLVAIRNCIVAIDDEVRKRGRQGEPDQAEMPQQSKRPQWWQHLKNRGSKQKGTARELEELHQSNKDRLENLTT